MINITAEGPKTVIEDAFGIDLAALDPNKPVEIRYRVGLGG